MKKLLLSLQFLVLIGLPASAQDDPPKTDQPPPTPTLERSADDQISEAPSESERPRRRTRHYRDRTVFGENAVVAEGDTVSDLTVILGNAEVNGQVRGDLVVVGGSAKLGTNAEVRGELVVVGGTLDAAPNARVDGDRVVLSQNNVLIPDLRWLERPIQWITNVAMTGRPFPYQYSWSWFIAGVFLLLYILSSILFSNSLQKTVNVLELRPGGSFFTGLLAFMLAVPLILFLVFSVVGVVLVPVIVFGLLAAFFFGKIAVYRYAGQQLGGHVGVESLQKPLVALLIGVVLFYALYMVPVLGFIVWAAIAPLALGAALLAFFKRFSTPKPAPAPMEAQTPLPGPPPPLTNQPVGVMPASFSSTTSFGPYRVGFWYRFVATVIDAAIVGTLFGMLNIEKPGLFLVVWVAYHVGMWTWKGATLGGLIMRTRVVRLDGQPIDFAIALVRAFSAFISAAALFLGFFWAGWTKERQSWHDRIAGTVVVKAHPVFAPAF